VNWDDFGLHARAFLLKTSMNGIPLARKELVEDQTAGETTAVVAMEVSFEQDNQTMFIEELAWLSNHQPDSCFAANYQGYQSEIADLKQASDHHLTWLRKFPHGDANDLTQADSFYASAFAHDKEANLTGAPC
jgi:hypothetical protein